MGLGAVISSTARALVTFSDCRARLVHRIYRPCFVPHAVLTAPAYAAERSRRPCSDAAGGPILDLPLDPELAAQQDQVLELRSAVERLPRLPAPLQRAIQSCGPTVKPLQILGGHMQAGQQQQPRYSCVRCGDVIDK